VDTQIPQPVAVLPEVHKKMPAERQESIDSNTQDAYLEGEEEGQDDDDEDADEEESTPGKVYERSKKSRQRKVRKSLEKLNRLSIEKKRRPRQIKSLTAITPAASTPITGSSSKAESVVLTPKRQSLWASLFGNG
jgi:hypothetical protein